jgi:hypothetical protein
MGRSILKVALATVAIAGLTLSVTTALSTSARAETPGGRLSGIDFLTGYKSLAQNGSEFRRIRADGANTVSFDVWWEVPSPSSSTVVPEPGATDSDADLLAGAQEARQAGLNVTLTPKIVIGANINSSGWRGEYNPPDRVAFFSDYQSMIDHYASLAQQAGMSMLLVGSEMIASDGYVGYWRQVIASARQHFAGPIGYEVDWREIPQFGWGDAVDVLLLSAYFPLSDEQYPTLAELEAGWHSYTSPGASQSQDAFSQVAGLAQRWGKPVVFGEAGYTATTYPANQPWQNASNASDPELQYLAYRALLDTFVGQPWWGGVLWWAWNDSDPRSPENKPAEGLIGEQSVLPGGPSAGMGTSSTAPGPSSSRVGTMAPVGSANGVNSSRDGANGPGGTGLDMSGSPSLRAPASPLPLPADNPGDGRRVSPRPKTGLVALRHIAGGDNGVSAGVALAALVGLALAIAAACHLQHSARTGARTRIPPWTVS